MPQAMLLLLILGCLAGTEARADDATLLRGSNLTIQDAVAKADVVFSAKLTSLGERDMSADHASLGPEFHGAQVQGLDFLKGHSNEPMRLAIFPNNVLHESVPVAGQPYLFFATGMPGESDYFVIKMLVATKENLRATLLAVLKDRAQRKLQQVQQSAQNNAAQ